MRQPLYSSGYTWFARGFVFYAGFVVLAFISANIRHPMTMDGSIVPAIFISVCAVLIVGILALATWRFSFVWLDDDVLEVR